MNYWIHKHYSPHKGVRINVQFSYFAIRNKINVFKMYEYIVKNMNTYLALLVYFIKMFNLTASSFAIFLDVV